MERKELNDLLNASVEMAKEQLRKRKTLAPFGLLICQGETEIRMPYVEDKQLDSSELLELMKEGIRKEVTNKEVDALSYVLDTEVIYPPGEAISVHLEARNEERGVQAYLPYNWKDGDIVFGEMQFSAANREFFK